MARSIENLISINAEIKMQNGSIPNPAMSDKSSRESQSLTPFPSLTGLRPQSNAQQIQSATVQSEVTLSALHSATASLDASPVTALQAAWAVVLAAYTAAQDEISFLTTFGPPINNQRNSPRNDSFRAIQTSIRLSNTESHGGIACDEILKSLTDSNATAIGSAENATTLSGQGGGLSKHATLIIFHEGDEHPGAADGTLQRSSEFIEKDELAVVVSFRSGFKGFLGFEAIYSDHFLRKSSALLMLRQLGGVLAYILQNPQKLIRSSSAALCASLLSTSNQAPNEFTECIESPVLQSQFEYHANNNPHRIALEFKQDINTGKGNNDTTLTYEQLNERANALARHLIHHFGDQSDNVIPICMERCPELYVAILGILKSGGAWCPIDHAFPARRRHDLIARTGARVLIVAEQKLADRDEGIPQGVFSVNIRNTSANLPASNQLPRAKKGSLAYLIWTSGTTGDPKGVPIGHKAAVCSMRALQKSIPVDVAGGVVRCLQFSQYTFDVFVQDLFYTWGVGGTIISSTREIMLASFAELANKTNATHAHLTPAFAASIPRKRCRTLEVITMIGERLSQVVADDWSQDMRAYNTYGPAETTVVATLRRFGAPGDEIRSENVGYPLPSISAFVMHGDQPVLRQGIGELALGGPQLSKGYWNDEQRSSERFVWNHRCCRYLYMTGDMVRQLHDGSLEFVGRTDDLIKIQGIRIELSEIGFSLRSCHPLVEQVEIQYLGRNDRTSKSIVAFLAAPKIDGSNRRLSQIIASEDAVSVTKSALLEAQRNLPDYMIPRVILVVNQIPRTTSAKTDKSALQNIYDSADLERWERSLAAADGIISEKTALSHSESNVIAIVAKLSGTSPTSISRFSDLRSIGIDSIAATRLGSALNAHGFPCAVPKILQCQTLNDLLNSTCAIDVVDETARFDLEAFHKQWYGVISNQVQIADINVAPALPLQESLLSESMQNANFYWSHVLLSLDTSTDLERLHHAWLQVASKTDALRTGFIPVAAALEGHAVQSISHSTFLQLIYKEVTVDWRRVHSQNADLQDFAAQQARVVAVSHQEAQFRHPLFAVTILDQPHGRTMMISVHHALRDEASLHFILDDVRMSYDRPGELSKLRHQWHQALQVMLPRESQIDRDEEFWSKMLKDFTITDDAVTWPDLTGKNLQGENPNAALVIHRNNLEASYKDLQLGALNLGASSVAPILRVAWGIILLMYLETDRVVFAETWSHRSDDFILEDVVGPLVSVLPVPFRAGGTAREVLIEQSNFQRESRAHRSVHARLIRKLIKRPENQPLYPALFNFLPDMSEENGITSPSLWEKSDSMVSLEVEHPMALTVAQTADGALEMEFAALQSIISPAQLDILAQQVNAVVNSMLNYPDTPLTQLPFHFSRNLLSATVLCSSEEVKRAFGKAPTEWVDFYAKAQPHWHAVQVVNSLDDGDAEEETWNFAELRSAYQRVATFIMRRNCRDQMLAVCLDRRIQVYAIILGILASGNTYLPIDEDLPGERKSFLLQDSKAAMLFTTRSLASTFPSAALDQSVLYVDDSTYMEQMPRVDSFDAAPQLSPDDNAYLLYTSGSTGVPKGVLVGRGNLCSFVEGLSEYIYPRIPGMKDLRGKGRYLGLASRAFDVHLAEMFLPWRQGMAAVTAPRTLLLDNLELALQRLRITHGSFVPSLIEQAGLDPASLPDLHYLGVGGEKMSRRVADMWASNENATLVNAYGPTEMSIGCTAAEVTPESNLRNVGRPYGNSVAHVLVPGSHEYTLRGVAGELCFTGNLVAKGYYNRSDAKGFVEDFHGERMYRTGDIVRLMPDDTVEYLRRDDDQTKVRGQRLELGEISEAIRSSAAMMLGSSQIEVATMVALHPKLSRSQLVSFVVAKQRHSRNGVKSPEVPETSDNHAMASSIKARCQEVLPAYMVPDVVIPLTGMPLAPSSGKADFKLLRALFSNISLGNLMDYASVEQSDTYESVRRQLTEAETTVQSAVFGTLSVEASDVTPHTNLFRYGLDSLSAISVAIRMQKLGYDCTVSSVLRNPVLSDLALLPHRDQNRKTPADRLRQIRSQISALENRFRSHHSHGLRDSSIDGVRPCLPLQETLVASSINNVSDALYVNHIILKLSTNIDLARLHRAWTRVAAHHEILRSCFQRFENGIVQIILRFDESRSISWEEIEVSDPDSILQALIKEPPTEIVSHISRKAPLRLILLRSRCRDKSSILLIRMHHALYDAESLQLLFEELDAGYHSAKSSTHTSFDSIIEYVRSQDREASEEFWKRYLNQCQSTSITDCLNGEHRCNKTSFTVDRAFSSPLTELEAFSSSMNGTLTSVIQGVFGIILAQTLGSRDVVFGAVLSGRTIPIEAPHTIIAPCITTIPQRVTLAIGSSAIVDIVKEAQKGFVESLEYQHTALRQIHRWVEADKPLFDCLVSYIQSKPKSESRLWTELEGSMANDFPLAIEFRADYDTNQLRAHCALGPEITTKERIFSLLENIDLLLGALVRREQVTVGDLGITNNDPSNLKTRSRAWDEHNWTPAELKIREIAAEISGVTSIDISKGASFFTLGIDSVTAIQFAQRLRKSGMHCSSADVMSHACVGALAQHIGPNPNITNGVESPAEQLHEEHMMNVVPGIRTLTPNDTVQAIYTCTPLQSSMLTQTLGSDGQLYVHQHAVRLSQGIDLARLRQAWVRLMRMTEILRTTFHFSETSNSWLGAVHHEIREAWTEEHVNHSVANSLASVAKSFDLCEYTDFERPPWQLTVIKSEENLVLVISMHHSLYDGESIRLLFQDLARSYRGLDLGSRPPFSDAASAISRSTADAEHFWIRKLETFRNGQIPRLLEDPATNIIEVQRVFKMGIKDVLQGCKDLGITAQSVALLAYGKSLACDQGYRDVVFGQVVGGRSLAVPGADEIVGPLFNTVPFRLALDKTYVTNAAAARRIQDFSGDSQTYQHAAIGKVQQGWRLKMDGGDADAQLFDALFVFQNFANTDPSVDGLWTAYDTGEAVISTEYSTNFEIAQYPEEMVVRVVSRRALIRQEQLQDLLINFEKIFQDILERPDRSVLAFPPSLQTLPLALQKTSNGPPASITIGPGPDSETIRLVLSEISHIAPEDISANASIFSLGLDSIAAIQVATTCRKRGFDVSVADVLQGRSLEGICSRVRGRKEEAQSKRVECDDKPNGTLSRSRASVLAGTDEDHIETLIPCLAGQEYHIASWLKSSRTTCEGIFTYESRERFSTDSLRSAWRLLRERHPILRTLFVANSPRETVQVVLKASALIDDNFETSDCLDKPEDCVTNQIKVELVNPFNLFNPPSRLHIIHTRAQDYVCLKLHHATYDAWSIRMIIEDLTALYRGIELQPPPPFDSFVHNTTHSLKTGDEQSYWSKALEHCQQTLLQPSTPSAVSQTTALPSSVFVSLPSTIANLRSLEKGCTRSSISLPTVILLAFARSLSRYTAVSNPTFGLYQTGRSSSFHGIEKLCAPCLNVTPVLVPQASNSPALESLQRLQADLAERVAFEQSYLRDILDCVVGSEGKKPLFNTFVNILGDEEDSKLGPSSAATAAFAEPLLIPYHPDIHPMDLAPKQRSMEKGVKTAVDALDTGFLGERNLYLDVVRRYGEDCVDFGIRCDRGLMDEGVVRGFATDVAGEVEGIVEEIGGGGRVE